MTQATPRSSFVFSHVAVSYRRCPSGLGLATMLALAAVGCDSGDSSEPNTTFGQTGAGSSGGDGTDATSEGAGSGSGGTTGGEAGTDGGSTTGSKPPKGTSGGTSGGTAAPPSGTSGGAGEVVIEPKNMIDDLDDGDGLIRASGGRQGAWYTYNDGTKTGMQTPEAGAKFTPSEGGPGDSIYYAVTTGKGFSMWGAGCGFDLNNPGDETGGKGMRSPFDASAFKGIVFRAKGNTPIRVKILVPEAVPPAEGGTCMSATKCNDTHGKPVALSADWKQIKVSFDDLLQEGWGIPAVFDAKKLLGLQFQVSANKDFEVALDEIGFY